MAARKKITGIIVGALIVGAAIAGWQVFGPNTNFEEDKKSLFIKTGSGFENVMHDLQEAKIIRSPKIFRLVAGQVDYDTNVKAGKFTISKGASIYSIVRQLRSGNQTPVNLVINKLRTKEDLAKKIGSSFETDSVAVIDYLNTNDSLSRYGLDTNTVMTAIIPNTYSVLWNTPVNRIFKKLYEEQKVFWNDERKQKAKGLNLTPQQAYIVASIVEEETNKDADKGKIASVYINRLETGMRLGADPTVKFAMKDFGLKRIYHKHLEFPSPYNTYRNEGLPPGPICTPSPKTIDAVLNSPSTSYLYFVAKPDLKGFSNFATSYQEHLKFAKEYQAALDSFIRLKQANAANGQ
ncbi:MAG: endolytic transglycosylase MltG [Ferruginibacter sp.]|nr:endolytic transglycosylase MltG [Ferruginibacter sp.]